MQPFLVTEENDFTSVGFIWTVEFLATPISAAVTNEQCLE